MNTLIEPSRSASPPLPHSGIPRPAFAPPSLISRVPEAVAADDEGELDAIELPPMLPGLPNTDYRNCAALICAIVWQAIMDRDVHWCAGPRFNFYLSLLGWDNATILEAKRRVLAKHYTFTRWANGNWLGGSEQK
jgi:hypothetical protein